MKLYTVVLFAAMAASASAQQIKTTVAVLNPLFGARIYPSLQVAEQFSAIEANAISQSPACQAGCEYLKNIFTWGIGVHVPAREDNTVGYVLTVEYSTPDGQRLTDVSWLSAENGKTASKVLYIGKPLNVRIQATPVLSTGTPLMN